jgi:hypothetical protein
MLEAQKQESRTTISFSAVRCHAILSLAELITCGSGAAHITGTGVCERAVSSRTRSIKLAVWMDVQALVTKLAIRKRPKHKQKRNHSSENADDTNSLLIATVFLAFLVQILKLLSFL